MSTCILLCQVDRSKLLLREHSFFLQSFEAFIVLHLLIWKLTFAWWMEKVSYGDKFKEEVLVGASDSESFKNRCRPCYSDLRKIAMLVKFWHLDSLTIQQALGLKYTEAFTPTGSQPASRRCCDQDTKPRVRISRKLKTYIQDSSASAEIILSEKKTVRCFSLLAWG